MDRRNFIKLAGALSLAVGYARTVGCASSARANPPAAPPDAPAATPSLLPRNLLRTMAVHPGRRAGDANLSAPELRFLPSWRTSISENIRPSATRPTQRSGRTSLSISICRFFHTGFQYKMPVEIHLIEAGSIASLPLFHVAVRIWRAAQAATGGLSIRFFGLAGAWADQPAGRDGPFLTFQGASYFRSIATGQAFGMSARAVSINTAQPSGEEFPVFRSFWMHKPAPGDRQLPSMRFSTGRASPAPTNSVPSRAAHGHGCGS